MMTIIIMINTFKDHVKNYFEPPGMCAGLESMATSRKVLAMLKIKFRFHVIPSDFL